MDLPSMLRPCEAGNYSVQDLPERRWIGGKLLKYVGVPNTSRPFDGLPYEFHLFTCV